MFIYSFDIYSFEKKEKRKKKNYSFEFRNAQKYNT